MFVAQAEFIHRQFPKLIGIADAALRPFDDFLGDKSRRRIVTNFQMQRIASLDESSGHILDGFRVKSLTSKEGGTCWLGMPASRKIWY